MNAKNCEELLSKKDVDGGLIGGASLKAPDFAVIVNAATKLSNCLFLTKLFQRPAAPFFQR